MMPVHKIPLSQHLYSLVLCASSLSDAIHDLIYHTHTHSHTQRVD